MEWLGGDFENFQFKKSWKISQNHESKVVIKRIWSSNKPKDKYLRVGVSIKSLYNIIVSGTFFVLVLFFQSVLQLNPWIPVWLNSVLYGLLIFSLTSPKLIGKLNHKTLMAIGCIISIIGCLILSYQLN